MKKIVLTASVATAAVLVLAPNASAVNQETVNLFPATVNDLQQYGAGPIPSRSARHRGCQQEQTLWRRPTAVVPSC